MGQQLVLLGRAPGGSGEIGCGRYCCPNNRGRSELRNTKAFEVPQRLFARKECAFARFLLHYAIDGARIARPTEFQEFLWLNALCQRMERPDTSLWASG